MWNDRVGARRHSLHRLLWLVASADHHHHCHHQHQQHRHHHVAAVRQANINEQQYEVVSQSSSRAVKQSSSHPVAHSARQAGSARQDQICQRVATESNALKTHLDATVWSSPSARRSSVTFLWAVVSSFMHSYTYILYTCMHMQRHISLSSFRPVFSAFCCLKCADVRRELWR